MSKLGTRIQQRRIHVKSPKNSQQGHVLLLAGGLAGGMKRDKKKAKKQDRPEKFKNNLPLGEQQFKFPLTNLHDVVKNDDLASTQLLLKTGANINATDELIGSTPLHIAAQYGYTKIVEVLLQNGAIINIQDNLGQTPLDLAKFFGHEDVSLLLNEKQSSKFAANLKKEKTSITLNKGQQKNNKKTIPLLNDKQPKGFAANSKKEKTSNRLNKGQQKKNKKTIPLSNDKQSKSFVANPKKEKPNNPVNKGQGIDNKRPTLLNEKTTTTLVSTKKQRKRLNECKTNNKEYDKEKEVQVYGINEHRINRYKYVLNKLNRDVFLKEKDRRAELKKENTIEKGKKQHRRPIKKFTQERKCKAALLNITGKKYMVGKVQDNGDCFFDALAQSLNDLYHTDIHTIKYLRLLCYSYYQENKILNDDIFKQNKYAYQGKDNETDSYHMIQYTAEECDQNFNSSSLIGGKKEVEGVMLCNKLDLVGICFIKIFYDREKERVTITFFLADQTNIKPIDAEEAKNLINSETIPIIINLEEDYSNVGKEYFFPLCKKGKSLTKPNKLAQERKTQHLEKLFNQVQHAEKINCQYLDLKGVELANLDLRGADFSGSNLTGANFTRSNLQGAKFVNTRLQKAKFCYADLTEVDFTGANLNGTKFKGANLHGMKYIDMNAGSFKGTLLADKKQLKKNFEDTKEIEQVKKEFSTNNKKHLIVVKPSATILHIHGALHTILPILVKDKRKYIILDFRRLALSINQELVNCNPNYMFQECSSFLRSPFFKPFVKNIVPICENKGLIIFLNSQLNKLLNVPSLDLHGNIPLNIKYRWIDNFIKNSYKSNSRHVEIITGRGLHNPQGIMGILWNECKIYLMYGNPSNYIQQIRSISKDGGWRVTLNKNLTRPSRITRKHIKEQLNKQKKQFD